MSSTDFRLKTSIANVSAALQTNINVNTSLIAVANTSIAANASAITVLQSDVAANTSLVTALSATLETRIATVSSTLQTSIDSNTSSISANASAIAVANTSIAANTSLITALSATLETRIAGVSSTFAATSATLETRIAGVSSTFAATSATLEGRIASVSATMATSISNHLPLAGGTMTGNLILNADPTSDLGATTKQYVDNLASGAIHFHEAVRLEQPGPVSATYDNGTAGVGATLTNAGTQSILIVDGVTAAPGDRILIYEQVSATQNGVYVATTVGSPSTNWVLTRSSDADTAGDGSPDSLDTGSYFFVSEGITGAGESYICNTPTSIVFGTTDINFVQFSSAIQYTAGTNINISGDRIISTSGVPTNADLAAVSATLATSIANVSATLESRIATVSSTMATSIATVSATLESRIAAVSGTLQTSIDANASAIVVANTSIAANASAITVANTNITANTSLIVALSATLETRITGVSSTFAATSATLATSIANAAAAAVAFAIALG